MRIVMLTDYSKAELKNTIAKYKETIAKYKASNSPIKLSLIATFEYYVYRYEGELERRENRK